MKNSISESALNKLTTRVFFAFLDQDVPVECYNKSDPYSGSNQPCYERYTNLNHYCSFCLMRYVIARYIHDKGFILKEEK